MYSGIVPIVDSKPATLSAYARWTGDYYTVSFNVIETFPLRRNLNDNGWNGASATEGKRLTIECLDTADVEHVHVVLRLWDDDNNFDTHTWYNVATTKRPPWGTKPLIEQDPHERELVEAQLLA